MGRPRKDSSILVESALNIDVSKLTEADILKLRETIRVWKQSHSRKEKEVRTQEFRNSLAVGDKIEFLLGKGLNRQAYRAIIEKIASGRLRVALVDNSFPATVRYEQVSKKL